VETDTLVAVPLKVTVCGLSLALSAMDSVPLAAPVAVGVNTTLMVQALPAPREVPQVLLGAWKTVLPVVIVMLVKVSVAVPELVTVSDWGALATPTPLEKVSGPDSVTAGLPVVVVGVLLLPPQPANTTNPTRTANRPLRVATERVLRLIVPPPE